ncbi:MAG: UDPGP type 1 family protein, partial [Planctomycetota bacterium]
GPVSGRTLFQFFADRLIATQTCYGQPVPLFLMTSAATDLPTKTYFETNKYLGLDPKQVTIFQQGTMPAVDAATGKLLLSSKDSLALSPDGHGGTLRALDRNGCFDQMSEQGIKYLFYFQVDNPLVDLCDPVFIGHHLLADSELTTQVIRKRYPKEKVGNVVQVDGKTQIIEYSDLPDQAAEMTDSAGGLKLWAGNIAVHLFNVDFLTRMKSNAAALPFHRASKKVPFVDASGTVQHPAEPNAIKFERFIFDLLPAAERTLICEVDPATSFAPVKNADGAATDTPELAKAAISDLHASWISQCGGQVDSGVCVEINPRFALDAAAFCRKIPENLVVSEDRHFDVRLD